MAYAISRPLDILVRSDILELSLAEPEYPERLVNAMVQRITRMVMTTMSSTRVNQNGVYFLVFGVGIGGKEMK